MRLVEYLILEATDPTQIVNKFQSEFKRDNPELDAPSPKQLVGALNRRQHSPGSDPTLDYIVNWFMKRGFLQQKGSMVVPTASGSAFRQAASQSFGGSDLGQAQARGYKALRRYFMDVTDQATKEYLETLDEPTLEAVGIARELEQEDIAILNGLRDRAENHRERQSFILSMSEKNPERLARLESLGFINEKTGTFNKAVWDKFVGTIKQLDPARIKTLVPKFYEWSTHSSGNAARNINRILFAIHPSSRNTTDTGRQVWQMLKTLSPEVMSQLQAGKKPKQGDMSTGAYNLLTTVVASVVRTFPNVKTADELIKTLDKEFESRVDFKSLDRSGDKTASRRQGVDRTFGG
jgi:hypothetical protein